MAHICLCDSETAYSPEELVAMILNYTRIIAQDYAGILIMMGVGGGGEGGGSITT